MWTCELGKSLQKESSKKASSFISASINFAFQKSVIALDFSIRWSASAPCSYFCYVCVQGNSLGIGFAMCNADESHEENCYKFTSYWLT